MKNIFSYLVVASLSFTLLSSPVEATPSKGGLLKAAVCCFVVFLAGCSPTPYSPPPDQVENQRKETAKTLKKALSTRSSIYDSTLNHLKYFAATANLIKHGTGNAEAMDGISFSINSRPTTFIDFQSSLPMEEQAKFQAQLEDLGDIFTDRFKSHSPHGVSAEFSVYKVNIKKEFKSNRTVLFKPMYVIFSKGQKSEIRSATQNELIQIGKSLTLENDENYTLVGPVPNVKIITLDMGDLEKPDFSFSNSQWKNLLLQVRYPGEF